ncbi:MAG: UDP-N-acetylmuramoyl-tripeptide--D-alanyl-D-alanine ligase [Patescibacteria group bacterium]
MHIGLILLGFGIAALSPLLTFAHLWQIKEWRWDRLMDHAREEGAFRTFLNPLRILVGATWAAGFLILVLAIQMGYGENHSEGLLSVWGLLLPAGLATLSILQITLRRQPLPVWTQKAKSIVALSVLLTTLFLVLFWEYTTTGYDKPGNVIETHPLRSLIIVLPFTESFVVMLAWTLLLPLDTFLKQRILNRARRLRSAHPEITVIGVTGSMGKTTTKELLACALGKDAIATSAYVNSEIGVARWLLKNLDAKKLRSQEASVYVVEMGAYRRGEIALLCSIAQPNLGVITAIGTQHIALFGSQEDLLSAKGELVEALPEHGHAFINIDSALSTKLRTRARCPVTTVGTGGPSDCEAFDIEETPRGIRFRVGETPFSLPLHGTHNVTNVLLTIAVAEHLKIPHAVIAERLSRFAPLPGTFSVEERNGVTVLNDTHNCSPESAAAAIRWAESRPASQKILLTSGIIEQGKETLSVHRELGQQCVPVFPRVIFLNKKLAQFFAQGYGKNVEIYSKEITPVSAGSLLVCLGRMPKSTIERLLPHS